MQKFKYPLIIASVVFVVGATFCVLYFFGPTANEEAQIEISSPFVNSSLQPTPSTSLRESPKPAATSTPVATTAPTPKASAVQGVETKETTGEVTELTKAEIKEIRSEINDLESRVSALEESLAGINTTVSSVDPNRPKEYYVYLGSGETQEHNWTDMDQVIAAIDTNNYGKIKSASFESALSITSGTVFARLKNKTTGGIFYETEISHNTSSSVWKQSPAFNLTSGYNEYVVELRSSSDEKARVDGARIKIIVE